MFDTRVHDFWEPPDTPRSRSLLDQLCSAGRAENQAAARRLEFIGELFEVRRAERGEEEHWAVDTWAAVGAEIAAALRISLGKAGSYISYGLAMRRLPAVAAVFAAGDIDMASFQTVVYRTELVTDEAARTEIDTRIAAWAARWPSMSRGRLIREIDRIVAARDPDAVRRIKERTRDRDVTIWDNKDGTADVSGRLFGTDAHLLDKRLDELAATVCDADPRTKANRRADALGALAAGAERLMCRCAEPQCPASAPTRSGVVIHIVAEDATLQGNSDRPGYLMGADTLIAAEHLRELAANAKLHPLISPKSAVDPEPRYRPSRALADFVRARDLNCRAPGCDRPATECDLDHTVPWSDGGQTHPSNIKCVCRFHHLTKTFWGWRDRQLPDGSVIWTLPDGQTYVTVPGSAMLFPSLTTPTGALPDPPNRDPEPASGRTSMMPRRKTTRSANRAHRITTERTHNRRARLGAMQSADPNSDADDPPF